MTSSVHGVGRWAPVTGSTRPGRGTTAQYRFLPAETGGRKVKMYVQMPFKFNIQK